MPSDLLTIGKSSLFSSKKSMQTAGHNIANVNTDGYSRQRTLQVAEQPVGTGKHVIGTGSYIKKIHRMNDQFVEKKLSKSTSQLNYNKEKVSQLSVTEDIFNELNSKKFNNILNNFFNSFRELSTQPESESIRTVVRDNARMLIDDVKRMNRGLNEVVDNMNLIVDQGVNEANNLIESITVLNQKIKEIEAVNGESGDLRDDRDRLLRDLSKYFEITTYVDGSNHFNVAAKGIGTVVTGATALTFKTAGHPEDGNYDPYPNKKEIYFSSKGNYAVSNEFINGRFGAIYNTQAHELSDLKESLNTVVFQLANTVNAIHRKGYINREIPTDKEGHTKAIQGIHTGVNFFEISNDPNKALDSIQIGKKIQQDLNNIATAVIPNSPGDNRIALAISKVQDLRNVGQGNSTFEESYLQGVNKNSVSLGKSKLNLEQSEALLAQVQAVRERISGVSIDEEAANMVRFQQAFNASAQVLKVAEEMFRTVLNIKT